MVTNGSIGLNYESDYTLLCTFQKGDIILTNS